MAATFAALVLPATAMAAPGPLTVGAGDPSATAHSYDGVADCASPTYATLEAAHTAATEGDTILLCPGTHAGGVTITKANLTIAGAGRATTVLEAGGGTAVVQLGAGASGTTLRDLSVASRGSTGVSGIYTNAALADVRLQGLRIYRPDTPYVLYGVTIHNNGVATNWQVDDVTINGYGVGFRVRGQAHGLTIRDSAFDGNSEGMSSVVASPAPTTPQLTGLLVERSSFDDNRNKGLYFETLSEATFDAIEVVGSGLKSGTHATPHAFEANLKGGAAEDLVIRDARVVGSDGVGINIKARSDQAPGTSLEGASVTGTVVTGNAGGVAFANAVSDASVTSSTLEGNNGVGLVNDTPAPVVATGNYWGCPGGPGTPGCDGVESPDGAAPIDVSAPLAAPAVGRRYVSATTGTDSANDCLDSGAPCATVQHGVDTAQPGDTVQLGAGVFAGGVTVAGKPVTIAGTGSGWNATTIQGPSDLDVLPACVDGAKATVCAGSGATLTVRDLTVDGNQAGASGIGFADANGTVARVRTTRTRDTYDSDGSLRSNQRGHGVEAAAAGGVARTVTVADSRIEDFQKSGVRVSGADLTVSVTGNTVLCSGPQAGIAANGITLLDGVGGSIVGNAVSGCSYTGPVDTSSIGMLLQDPSTLVVEGNSIAQSDRGLYVRGTPTSEIEVAGNTFTGNTLAIDVDAAGTVSTVTVGTNDYSGNGEAINGIAVVELVTPSLSFAAKPGAYAGRQRVDLEVTGGSASIRSVVVDGHDAVFDVNASACTSSTLDADETCAVWLDAASAVQGDFAGTLAVTTRGQVPVIGQTSLAATFAGTLQGGTGDDGAVGPVGPAGPDGAAGVAGNDGAPGTNGSNGADGAPGARGDAGAAGPQGLLGLPGAKGDVGAAGPLVLAVSPVRITDESRVVVATVVCPASACRVAARTATLKIGKRTFRLQVRTSSRVARGKAGTVTLVLTREARQALALGKKGVARVRITVDGKSSPVIKTTLRAAPAR
ncbi:MAG: right-handed parallel beta-helix repeat-containing protein [Patulibacter sp.]